MNIFKKAKEAFIGLLKRKKTNIKKVNTTPDVSAVQHGHTNRHAPRKYRQLQQHELRDPKKIAELQRNAWKNGGTGSWAKAAKNTDEHKGRQQPAIVKIRRRSAVA